MRFFFVLYLTVLGSVACIGFWNYARLSGPFRLLNWFILYILLSESLTRLDQFSGKTYIFYWVYNLLIIPVTGIVFTWLARKKLFKGLIALIFLCGFALGGILFLNADHSAAFPSQLVVLSTPIIVIGAMLLFVDILSRDEHGKISKNPEFLFGASLIVYKCIGFVHLGLYEYLIEASISPWVSIWIHSTASILYYALFGYIFILAAKQHRDKCSTSVVR